MNIKKKFFISIAVSVIIIIGAVLFLILPTINDIKNDHAAVYVQRVDLEKKYLRGQLLKQTISNFDKVKPLEDRFIKIFVLKDKELEFITALEKIAAINIIAQKINLQPSAEKQTNAAYVPLALEITAQGEYNRILKYLSDLEKLDYQINISSLNFAANKENKEIASTFKAEVYLLAN